MTVEEKLEDGGYEDVVIFSNPSYDTAFIGVTYDNRAVYDWNKMVQYLIDNDDMDEESAIENIEYNTIRSIPYLENAPIIMYPIED